MTTITAEESSSKMPNNGATTDASDTSSKATVPPVAPHHLLPPQEEENILRQSLKEIGEDIQKMEDFITLTEDIIRRERERDRELYVREQRRRKLAEQMCVQQQQQGVVAQAIPENREMVKRTNDKRSMSIRNKIVSRLSRSNSQNVPSSNTAMNSAKKRPTFRLKSTKNKRKTSRKGPVSRLIFHNGKVACADTADDERTNVEKTHAIVKSITDCVDQFVEPIAVTQKRQSIVSNFSDILSDESSISMQNDSSFFNFECSAVESDDPIPTEDYLCVDNLSDKATMDEFCGEAFKRRESKAMPTADIEIREDAIRYENEVDNEATANRPTTDSAHSDQSNTT